VIRLVWQGRPQFIRIVMFVSTRQHDQRAVLSSFVEMFIRACSGWSLFCKRTRDSGPGQPRRGEETRLKSPSFQSKHARDHKAGLRSSIS
jgi:hypothetical protein